MPVRVRYAFVALAACVVVASLPALTGSWVYDDRLMVGNPMYDGVEDIAPAFTRTSEDYMARTRRGPAIGSGSTYRPLPMASLIVVNAAFGTRPLPHHVFSLLAHLAVIFLLLVLGSSAGRIGWKALFVVTIFALHPANLEAYGWINACSDVLAGIALAAILVRPQPRWLLFLFLLAGALCKETFLLAALVAVVARRPGWRDLAVFALAVVATVTLRLVAGATAPSEGLAVGRLLGRLVPVARLAVETWVVPWPHAMRLLAWETTRPFAVADIAAPALLVVIAAVLAARGELRRATLVAGALFTLLPVLLVADAFWLGFDRYLYLPGILLVAAALPETGGGRGWAIATVATAALLGAATFVSARAYRSHSDLTAAVIADRPDEPTGYVFAASDASDRGDRRAASALLDQMPADDLPAPLAHAAATELLRVGRSADAATLVERAAATYPDDANLRFDILTLRGAQKRWPEVVALARGFAADPLRRKAVSELIDGWDAAGVLPADVKAELSSPKR